MSEIWPKEIAKAVGDLEQEFPAEPFFVTPSMLLHSANRPIVEAVMRSFGISEKALSAHFKALEGET